MKLKLMLVLSLLFIILTHSLSQTVTNKLFLGETITLNSKILGEDRLIFISKPQGYENLNRSYPVMYLLDGRTHFLHATGIAEFLARNGIMPQMIVVAIANTDRNRDFTPTHSEQVRNSGGAENFTNFLKDELIPFITNNYRTQPYKIIFGHSLTGMYEINLLAKESNLFNDYIIASPYLMYDNEVALKSLESFLDGNTELRHALYISVGNEPNYFPSLEKLSKMFEDVSSENFEWKYEKFEKENHGTVPHKSIYNGLEFIFSGWRISNEQLSQGIDAVNDHYKILSERFGYEIKTPESIVNQIGYSYLNQNKINAAIKIFQQNIKNYPESANVYDSMGDAYFTAGKFEDAKENYSMAVQKGKDFSDPNLNIYKANLQKAIDKILE